MTYSEFKLIYIRDCAPEFQNWVEAYGYCQQDPQTGEVNFNHYCLEDLAAHIEYHGGPANVVSHLAAMERSGIPWLTFQYLETPYIEPDVIIALLKDDGNLARWAATMAWNGQEQDETYAGKVIAAIESQRFPDAYQVYAQRIRQLG